MNGRTNECKIVTAALTALCALATCAAGQATFQGLGIPPDAECSTATAVSEDGLVVIGDAFCLWAPGSTYGRWTAKTGWEDLGPYWGASAVNGDGSIIVGAELNCFLGCWAWPVWRWTEDSGQQLTEGALPTGISQDGSVVVGYVPETGRTFSYAFRWSAESGLVWYYDAFSFQDVSADGSSWVGNSNDGAALWTIEGDYLPLGKIKGAIYFGARAMTSDASVIVGGEGSGPAFRWTQIAGGQLLGPLPGDVGAEALAVSDDGTVVVGRSGECCWAFSRAFIWHAAIGMVDLNEYLPALGVDLSEWKLLDATGISADGLTIAGNGINPKGQQEAWIATIPPIVIPADLDGDGIVGASDLAELLVQWGVCPPPEVGTCIADIAPKPEGDGVVGAADLAELLANWSS